MMMQMNVLGRMSFVEIVCSESRYIKPFAAKYAELSVLHCASA